MVPRIKRLLSIGIEALRAVANPANRIEKPAGTPFGCGLSSKFFVLIAPGNAAQPRLLSGASSLRGLGIELRPSDRYLPLPATGQRFSQSSAWSSASRYTSTVWSSAIGDGWRFSPRKPGAAQIQ